MYSVISIQNLSQIGPLEKTMWNNLMLRATVIIILVFHFPKVVQSLALIAAFSQ